MISSKALQVARRRADFYIQECKKYTDMEIDFENATSIPTNSHTAIKAFENIVTECKEEVENADKDQVLSLLNLFYGIDVENFDDSKYSQKIWEIIENYINDPSNKDMLIESDLVFIMDKLDDIQNDIGLLSLARKELQKENGLLSFSIKKKLTKLESILKDMLLVKKRCEDILEAGSSELVKLILDNFYNIFIFLNFLNKAFIYLNKPLLQIEIASAIDRMMNVMTPSYLRHSLDGKHMLFYRVVYEFKVLKESIISQ